MCRLNANRLWRRYGRKCLRESTSLLILILTTLQLLILLQATILIFTEKRRNCLWSSFSKCRSGNIPSSMWRIWVHSKMYYWRYIILERLKDPLSSSKGGRMISHPPGTGKTRLTIVFHQSFLKMFRTYLPVIIALSSLLFNWEVESLK